VVAADTKHRITRFQICDDLLGRRINRETGMWAHNSIHGDVGFRTN